MFIGDKIKALRKSQKMTLTELSQKSGVQLATLSRIEHKKMVGTLESHMNIAKALGIDVTQLYGDPSPAPSPIEVETPQSLTDQFKHNEHSSYEILTKKVLNKQMMPVLIRLDKDGETAVEQGKAGSEKFIFVLEGHVEAVIGEQSYVLEKAHTLYFDAALPHRFKNKGQQTAKILSISTPVTL
jgi:transcriptional regulator with XRE-family HTH domain